MPTIDQLRAQLTRSKTLHEQKLQRFEELDRTLADAGLTKDIDPDEFFASKQKEIDAEKRRVADDMERIAEELIELEGRLK